MPTVSILMPVYNGSKFLRAAIESILAQTYQDFELLIIDDGSTDGSHDIVSSYGDDRIILVNNESHYGLPASLNRGLRLADGELIARQDADDLSLPCRLEQQVRFLQDYQKVALVGTQYNIIDERGNFVGTGYHKDRDILSIRWAQCFHCSFIHSSVMFRRDIVLEELGGYDESFSRAEDFDLWSRIVQRHEAANLPTRLVCRRIHSDSTKAKIPTLQYLHHSRVIRRSLSTIFANREFTELEIALASNFRSHLDRTNIRSFIVLFQELLQKYLFLYPEVLHSRSFRNTLVWQHAHIASSLLRRRSPSGLLLMFRGAQWSPAAAFPLAMWFVWQMIYRLRYGKNAPEAR